jgi:type III restriction enzyme
MELKLESNLSHQLKPVMAVASVVEASMATTQPEKNYQNPLLAPCLSKRALREVQGQNHLLSTAGLPLKDFNPKLFPKELTDLPKHLTMDVKMETGTGKTYVYTRTMLELHRRCGLNKFIIAVPTLPIKAGTASFLDDPEVMRHFSDVCSYNAQIELCLLETQKGKKKGRQYIPAPVRNFFLGNSQQRNRIYVLVLNAQLLTNGKLLTRNDYDQPVGGFYRPAEAIRDTRPVLIIDEPHRMERKGKSYAALINNFEPQLVLRYGATFPEFTIGKGKQQKRVKDYENLVYDLDAAQSFNEGLIKGVAKEHLELPGKRQADRKVKITSIVRGDSVNMQYISENHPAVTHTLHKGDSLSIVDTDFEGVTVDEISSKAVILSNGQEKHVGEEFFPDQYSASYQEGMIDLALMRHFETERANFCREGLPIKSLALFFIDNIESFRGPEDKNDGWLRMKFLSLLEERVKKELARPNTQAYADYLQATLDNLDKTCVGYFSKDNVDSDENIGNEVKTILHGKKELLSFRHADGSLNVTRFLFSKWTLKEGWDNPNVFTICKLRSSGSEISKLQEVGRGLRLPVDSAGNRISDESFMLNYIVDFTERDFANKLVAEINSDVSTEQAKPLAINSYHIEAVAQKRGMDPKEFFIELLKKDYVNFRSEIQSEHYDDLLRDYPEFAEVAGGVNPNHIVNRNSKRKETVHIRKARFEELRDLWSILNKKYVLYFDQKIDDQLQKALPVIIRDKHVFSLQVLNSTRETLSVDNGMAYTTQDTNAQITVRGLHFAYNEFLKRASRSTNIPVQILHQAFKEVAQTGTEITNEMFNEDSLSRLIKAVEDWKCETLTGLVCYKQAHYRVRETKLTNADGSVKEEVVQTYIGSKNISGVPPVKYLYDSFAYDSGLELKNIRTDIDEVVVYGKIPSHSICIPTVASSNYSPDFMYVVRRTNGTKELNVVIETKAYDNESQVAPDEEKKIECAQKFFEAMRKDGYDVKFRKQLNTSGVKAIIDELIQH